MGISDLLAMLQGGGNLAGGSPGADMAGPAGVGGAGGLTGGGAGPGGVAGMLGSNSSDPMMTSNGPPPQTITPDVALAPGAQDPSASQSMQAPVTYTPPDNGGGVGGFLNHMIDKAKAVDPATGMSFADRFGRFAGQMSDLSGATKDATDRWQANMDRNAASDGRAQLGKMADDLGMSPRERLMFQANPNAWVDANKSRLGYHDQAPSSTGYYGEPGQPGSTQATAPAAPAPAADPLADLKTQAQIDEMHSRRALQDAQAGYYGVKTKQPYAPKVKALGRGAVSGLPAGYVPR